MRFLTVEPGIRLRSGGLGFVWLWRLRQVRRSTTCPLF